MKRMNQLAIALAICALAIVGCNSLTKQQETRIQTVARGAVQSAAVLDLTAFPGHRAYLLASKTAVDECISRGTVTAATLGKIVATLPIDPAAMRYTSAGLLIWDSLSVFWMTPETDAALLAAARGISEGLTGALASVPVGSSGPRSASARASAVSTPSRVPEPVWTGPGANVRRL